MRGRVSRPRADIILLLPPPHPRLGWMIMVYIGLSIIGGSGVQRSSWEEIRVEGVAIGEKEIRIIVIIINKFLSVTCLLPLVFLLLFLFINHMSSGEEW